MEIFTRNLSKKMQKIRFGSLAKYMKNRCSYEEILKTNFSLRRGAYTTFNKCNI